MLNYIEVKGNDYEMGFQLGQYFKNYLQKRILDFNTKIEKVINNVKLLENKMRILFPNLLQEIYGRADGANISRNSTLLMFFPEILKKLDGCTTVIVKQKDRVLFAHNEDNSNFTEKMSH